MWGDNRGNFRPLAAITRAEAAAVLARTQISVFDPDRLPAQMNGFNEFSDVRPDSWYHPYVAWAYHAGLITGDPACASGYRRFRPGDPITRQEFAAMTARTAEIRQPGPTGFYDWDQVSDWARGYVYTALQTGWMVGNGQGEVRPIVNISRAEVATTVNRTLGRVDSWHAFESVNLQNPCAARDFPDVDENGWYLPSVISAANNYRKGRDGNGGPVWKEILPQCWD